MNMYGLPIAHRYHRKPLICFNISLITQISQVVMFYPSIPQECNPWTPPTSHLTRPYPNPWIQLHPKPLSTRWLTKEQFPKDLTPDHNSLHPHPLLQGH